MTLKAQADADLGLGCRVRIKNYPGPIGKIIELRGPLGPNGANIYRVAIPQRPGFTLVELRGNQLELITRPTPRNPAPKPRPPGLKKRPRRRPGSSS